MRRTRFDTAPCPIARTTDLMGDSWTSMVLREIAYGMRRFEQIQERLDCSRATLTERLTRLVDERLLDKSAYQSNPLRYEYSLTPKGLAFFDVLAAMWRFGEDWLFPANEKHPAGASIEMINAETGTVINAQVVDVNTGQPINLATLKVRRKRRPDSETAISVATLAKTEAAN
jgi:DNA-binding HxlR family transcriptional regulator